MKLAELAGFSSPEKQILLSIQPGSIFLLLDQKEEPHYNIILNHESKIIEKGNIVLVYGQTLRGKHAPMFRTRPETMVDIGEGWHHKFTHATMFDCTLAYLIPLSRLAEKFQKRQVIFHPPPANQALLKKLRKSVRACRTTAPEILQLITKN